MRVNDRYVSVYYKFDEEIGSIEIEQKKTALLIIDMQYVFTKRKSEDGKMGTEAEAIKAFSEFYDALDETVIPNTQRILHTFREKELQICHAKIQAQTSHGRERSYDQKATGFNEILLIPGDTEAEIIEELAPIKDEIVVTKTTDSALTGTNLRLMLYNMGVDTVVVCGVFTDQCVSSTVRSLADESFKVWLIEDACMAGTKELQEQELTILNNIYCHVINTAELIKAL